MAMSMGEKLSLRLLEGDVSMRGVETVVPPPLPMEPSPPSSESEDALLPGEATLEAGSLM